MDLCEEYYFDDVQDTGEEAVVEYDITATPRDINPTNIVDMIDSGIMELPLFQRNYVWDIKKASKLVESLILGLPVPELFFYCEDDESTTYKIIDGQQRLLSIYFFVKGRFPKSTNSRLQIRKRLNETHDFDEVLADNSIFQDFTLQLNSASSCARYDGKKYTSLDKETQIKFRLRRFLRAVIIRQNKPDNCSSMFEIFNRLNTGGTPLNHQEIRASLYYCKFYEMLLRLNDCPTWRKLLGQPTQDLRSNDVELILRALALLENSENYSPKMVTFLNTYSQHSTRFEEPKVSFLEQTFLHFLSACTMLDEKTFFRNNRFSKPLFESVFVAACQEKFKEGKFISGKIMPQSIDSLKNDSAFSALLMSGSTSTESIITRIEMAKNHIYWAGENYHE